MKFQSTQAGRLSLNLTVYTDGCGSVRELRRFKSEEEVEEVLFLDVAEQLETDSVLMDGLDVLEQSFSLNFGSGQKLLEKYVGQTVKVMNGEQQELQIRLLSVKDGVIGERTDTKEILVNPSGELVLPALPEEFLIKPALAWKIARNCLNEEVKVSYLTRGISWEASYVIDLQGEQFRLSGWANIRNDSGMDYPAAKIKLVAGNIHRHEERLSRSSFDYYETAQPDPEPRQFADYHVYELVQPATILDEQVKQVKFLHVKQGDFRKVYEIQKWSERPTVKVNFINTASNGLGIALSKGTVKVYEQDSGGVAEFIGEDVIGHTPAEELVSLTIGEAFDIVCNSREKKRERREGFEYVTYEYELKNQKDAAVRLDIIHSMYDLIWEMESSSHDYEIERTDIVKFHVRVPAKKEAHVEFIYKVGKRTPDRLRNKN